MPNISVQLRRGTDTEHSSFTGAEGEVTVDTTNDTLRVHDGTTAGGIRLAKLSEAGGSGTVTSVDSGTGLTGGPITTSGTLSLASIANLRALGNVSGSNAAPVAVEIKDDDTMATASATSLATSESIKAYVDSKVVATPEIHSYHTAPIQFNVSDKISVNDFSEGIDTTSSNATKIDQAVGDGGTFKMFKTPASGTCILEIDAALQDTDSDSSQSFRLDLISCTSETGVTKTSDGTVSMTTLVAGAVTGGSSTAGTRGSSRVKYQKVMANSTFFYLKVIRNGGATSCNLTATVKVTTY